MERNAPGLRVEVVYAEPRRQVVCSVVLPPGSTVQDAIEQSGMGRGADTFAACKVGVFGRVCPRNTLLKDGDRVELYRPLLVAPKEARHARSKRNRQARKPG